MGWSEEDEEEKEEIENRKRGERNGVHGIYRGAGNDGGKCYGAGEQWTYVSYVYVLGDVCALSGEV